MPSPIPECSCKLLHNWGFPSPPHREITHDHDQTAQGFIMQNSFAIQERAQLNDPTEKVGKTLQNTSVNSRACIFTTAEDYIHGVEFKIVKTLLNRSKQ